jgi:hypothetical protein
MKAKVTPLRSSMKRIDCPDGPRFFLKNPEQVFAIHFSEWGVRVSELINLFSRSNLAGTQDITVKTSTIVKNLTERYAALQSHYQTAYLGWYANPCSKDAEKKFHEAKDLICAKWLDLAEIEKVSGLTGTGTGVMFRKLEASDYIPKMKEEKVREKKGRRNPPSEEQKFKERLGERTAYSLDNELSNERLDKIQELISKLKI